MKSFAFLVLIFSAVAIAEKADIKQWVEDFGTDVETVQMCINEAGTTEAELIAIDEQLENIEEDKIDDEVKKNFDKYSHVVACLLEKTEMMKDSKLNVDKIIETVEKEDGKLANKDTVIRCLNELNDDSELTREQRAMSMTVCVYFSNKENKKK